MRERDSEIERQCEKQKECQRGREGCDTVIDARRDIERPRNGGETER